MFAKLTLKTDDFDKRIDKATTRGKNAEKGMDILQKTVEKLSPETHALSNKLSVLTEQYNKQKEGVKKLTDEFNAEVKASGASSEAAQALKEKLDEAQKRMASTAEEMDKVKKSLTDATTESGKANTRLSKLSTTLGTGLANAAKIGAKVVAASTVAAAGAVTVLVKKSTDAYGNFEQLEGGVETLFKGSKNAIMRYADNAYKTAGLSANRYMETVTSFSRSLLQSLGGDTEKAAKYADRAVTDMADNANKMGTNIESIQYAYAGFAKQNYTMLDNLKLGYGGTKEEMRRLIADASKLTDVQKELNVTVKDGDLSFGNIVNAISVVQKQMGVTGTTAAEAEHTIQGSFNALKAAWENLLTDFGKKDFASIAQESVGEVVNAGITYLGNIMPVAINTVRALAQSIEIIVPELVEKMPEQLNEFLPEVVQVAWLIVSTLGQTLLENTPSLIENGITLLSSLVTTFVNNIPQFVDFIVQMIKEMRKSLIGSSPKLIAAGLTLIGGLVGGLLQAFVALGGDFIKWIWDGAKEAFEDLKKRALTWGGDMINGFIDGIKAKIEDVKAAASSVANAVKNFLHFSRPDVGPLREYEKWMPDFMAGLAKGINDNKYLVTDEIKDLANEMRIDGNFDKIKIDKSGANGNGKLGAVSVVQNIYSKAQTASDLMQEALYQQKKAVLLGNV